MIVSVRPLDWDEALRSSGESAHDLAPFAQTCRDELPAGAHERKNGRIFMKKLEAVIQPSRVDAVKEALNEIGVQGMTLSEVRGHGRQKGHSEVYRGNEYTVDLLPKVKVEVVLPDELVESALEAVAKAARTGKIGDGKIFVSDVIEAVRIRDRQRGNQAL